MDTKFCRDCREHLPVAEFSKNARSRDGLAFYCRRHLAERAARSREARRVQPRKHRFAPVGLTIPPEHKWCPDCQTVKPLEEFPRTAAAKSGRGTYCLPCHNLRGKESLEKIGVDYQSIDYAHAIHAFTNPDADRVAQAHGMVGKIGYNEPAARRSWLQMRTFFDEIFGNK